MTRTISLIIGIATAALVVGVPTAFGEGRLAGSPEPGVVAPDWFERAAIRAADGDVGVVVTRPDSHDIIRYESNGYLDSADRAQRIDVVVPTALTDSFERSAPPRGSGTGGSTVNASSGSDLDWSQLGTGFGIGLALALGLFLAMRHGRGRQLAH